ncbi:hypothetical protein BGZ60DRAFT_387979, partial [Tricladium varicosporioides]
TADNIPLSFTFQEIVQTERALKRNCRDWSKLERFYNTLKESMFCPAGSEYNFKVDEFQVKHLSRGFRKARQYTVGICCRQ